MHIRWVSSKEGFGHLPRTPPTTLKEEQLLKKWKSSGYFWLPDRPEDKLPGEISFIPGQAIYISIIGSFKSLPQFGVSDLCKVINASLANGLKCTIVDSIYFPETFFTKEKPFFRTRFQSKLLIAGIHFECIENFSIEEIGIKFSKVNNWLECPYSIKFIDNNYEETNFQFKPVALNVPTQFQKKSFVLSTFCERTIPLPDQDPGGEISWTYQYVLIIHPSEPQNLLWFFKLTLSLRNFFMFLIGSNVCTLELSGSLPSLKSKPDDNPREVRVYAPVYFPRLEENNEGFSTYYSKIGKKFNTITETWFEKYNDIEEVMRGYAELVQNDGAQKESVFLRIVQILEHFYGYLFKESKKYLPKKYWKYIQNEFQYALDGLLKKNEGPAPNQSEFMTEDLKKTILNRISSLNKKSFRSCLTELFNGIPKSLLLSIFRNPSEDIEKVVGDFLKSVENTRNYLTHFDAKLKRRCFSERDLERATLICWAVLNYWIAKTLNFEEKTSSNIAMISLQALFIVSPPDKF